MAAFFCNIGASVPLVQERQVTRTEDAGTSEPGQDEPHSHHLVSIRRLMFTCARESNWLTVLVSLFWP
jgi:hypothetical protein